VPSASAIARPDLLGDVVALVPAGDDERFAQRQFPRTAGSFFPWFCEQFLYAIFQFIKLLAGQA
jgi:hypothetical protein